jgi:hypothetical protein
MILAVASVRSLLLPSALELQVAGPRRKVPWQRLKACEVRTVTESWRPDMAERSKNPAANRKKTDQSPAELGGELARVKSPADAGLVSTSG